MAVPSLGSTIPIRSCQVWLRFLYGLGGLGVALASSSLALRTIALWNNNKIVRALASTILLGHISFLTFALTQVRGPQNTESNTCNPSQTEKNIDNFLVTTCTDMMFLIILLTAVWRNRKSSGLWKGVLWVAGLTFGELPAIILIALNLNDPMNLLLQPYFASVMAICATRMYRDLCEYARPLDKAPVLSFDVSPMKSGPQPLPRPITSMRMNP
ncbi:hypothetical protein Clacol_001182 [Clathrus columnatus]|uniref:Uncharacterized protein n=1 Tax=Clathrus columnatus TaxID=1419009 RepID=A0AAV5A2L4_9AGAM|nr:hypothetical protein Clacol_001182 [Clathrus columnatus]